MKIIDISTRGILPFKESKKITFKQNFNFLYGLNGSGKSTIYRCILSALFDEGWKELKDEINIFEKEPPRVAVTFRSEKEAYRVTRDIATGKFVLYRYDFKQKTFVEESRDPFILASLLDEKFQLLPYHLYKPLCTLSHESISVRKIRESSPVVQEFTSQPAVSTRRREELLKELEFAKEIERMEEEISEKERELFNLKKEMESRENLREEIKLLEKEIEDKKILEEFSSTAQDKLSQYRRLRAEKERIESSDKSKIESLEEEIRTIGEANVLKNKRLIGSGVAFILLFILIFLKDTLAGITGLEFFSEYFHYILFPLVLMSLVFIVYFAFKEASRKGKREKLEKELKELKFRYTKAVERIDLELRKIDAIMKALNIHSPDELGERINEYNEKKAELEEKRKRLEEEERRISDEELMRRKEDLEGELDRLKSELQKRGSPSMTVHEIEEELRMLEEQTPYSLPQVNQPTETVEISSSAIDEFIERLAEHTGLTQEEAISNLYNTFIPLMKNVFGNDYEVFTFYEGKPGLRKVDGEFLELNKMNQSSKDALLILLVISFVKYSSEFRQMPLIMDDPFITQDDRRKKVFLSALKELSENVQVILFSRSADGKEFADNYIEI